MNDAFIGLGSNLGAPVSNLRDAVLALDALSGTDVVFVSHVYESEPWGVVDQPPFANAVAWIRTTLRADQLLGELQDAESSIGRRPASRYGPRVIDLDLLLFGDEEWSTTELVVPHPRMAERDFVITPLLTVAPHAKWPDGTAIRASGEMVGRVIADLGRLPAVDPDWYAWEARTANPSKPPAVEEIGPWDPAEAWVEVAQASAAGGQIDIMESKLRGAEIPYELSHREMGDAMGFLAGPARILVPAAREHEARLALRYGPGGAESTDEAIADALRVPDGMTHEPESPPERPAWFRVTLSVFGWLFMAYWIIRILGRPGY